MHIKFHGGDEDSGEVFVVETMSVSDQLDAVGIAVSHRFAGGLYAKEMRVPAGAQIGKHRHGFDHFSALMQGSAELDVDGTRTVHQAPALLTIEAGKRHVITALTDIVWHCIHATDETEADKIDAVLTQGKPMNFDYDNGRLVPKQDFNLVTTGVDVRPYMAQLRAHPALWDQGRDFRKVPRYGGELSPHRDSHDIWVRHQNYDALGDYDTAAGRESIMKPAVSEWYPEAQKLPAAVNMAAQVCMHLGAIQLGGSYVIKIEAGKKVHPHRDFSWHSTYYKKYMVILKTQPGVVFGWERSGNMIPDTGDLWNF